MKTLKGILSKTYDLKTKKPKYGINWFKVDSYFPELEEQEKGGDEIEK